MAVLTTCLTRLRSDFNTRFPGRDKDSDGWIGDSAHEDTTSGHNPDESGGGEYEDSDSKDEVRAIDVDDDLSDPGGTTMQQVLDRIIATPRDIKRLKYIIYNRKIASRTTGWRWENYSGSNPHDRHGHISGDPLYDEDAAPFTSVLEIGDEMALTEAETASAVWGTNAGPNVNYRVQALFSNRATSAQPGNAETNQLAAKLGAMDAKLDAIAAKVQIDPAELQQIQDAAYAGAVAGAADAEEIADAVVEKLNHVGLTDEQIADVKTAVIEVELYGTASGGAPSTT